MVPHRRWLAGPTIPMRRTISALLSAFKSVFIRAPKAPRAVVMRPFSGDESPDYPALNSFKDDIIHSEVNS